MLNPQVHVPFDILNDKLETLNSLKFNIELYFSGGCLDNAGPDKVRSAISRLDYKPVFTIHGPFMDLNPGAVDSKVRQATRERFHQVFDIAERVGPKRVVFHSGYEKWKYGHNIKPWLEGSLSLWPEFIRRAQKIGAVIAIENIFEDNPENLSLLMKGLDSNNIGVCFDTGHFNIFSKVPINDWLESIGQHVREMHLHDNRGDLDSHNPIGEGTFDFDRLFSDGMLKQQDVVYTIESHSPEAAIKSIEALRRHLS